MDTTQAAVTLMLQIGMFTIALMGLGISALNLLIVLWKHFTEHRQK
ncbi:hypothetical protein [Tumebacillus avium]|nr:hypothetical protein [Tumebacillus avium]